MNFPKILLQRLLNSNLTKKFKQQMLSKNKEYELGFIPLLVLFVFFIVILHEFIRQRSLPNEHPHVQIESFQSPFLQEIPPWPLAILDH